MVTSEELDTYRAQGRGHENDKEKIPIAIFDQVDRK